MKEEIPLIVLYNITVDQFPAIAHDADKLLSKIQTELLRDPIRTSALRSQLEREGLSTMYHRDWPPHDLLHGLEAYLTDRNIPEQQTYLWIRRIKDEQLLYQE